MAVFRYARLPQARQRVWAIVNLRIIVATPTEIDINLHFVSTNSTVCVGVSTGQHTRPTIEETNEP